MLHADRPSSHDTTTHHDRRRAGSRDGPRWLPGHSPHVPHPRAGDPFVTPATDESAPVICAVDDDGLAPGVLATGAMLAERLNVPLTVVHSAHPDVFLTGEPHRVVLERGNALVDRLTEGYHVDGRVVEVEEPGEAHLWARARGRLDDRRRHPPSNRPSALPCWGACHRPSSREQNARSSRCRPSPREPSRRRAVDEASGVDRLHRSAV